MKPQDQALTVNPMVRSATTPPEARGLKRDGVRLLVSTGDRLRVDITNGILLNLTSGKSLNGRPAPEFLMKMLEAGGLIPFLKSGQFLNR